MANFSSGFTQGTLGVGIDAFAQLGVRLDSGGGRSGAGGSVDLLPYDDQGRPQDDYSRAGGAVKLRWYGTVLRVGDVFPETPVIQYGNSRLFPLQLPWLHPGQRQPGEGPDPAGRQS
ncbi:OprD family porin [Pseudomonas aeruginosa]|nr:OprD family porin [Pseudomonas aeruginosa]